MTSRQLTNNDLEKVSGGQLMAENVMGVNGLTMCTGTPTSKNPEGVFWDFHGIALTKEEAMKKLKKKATRTLDTNITSKAFLSNYINNYNNTVYGYTQDNNNSIIEENI